MAVVRCFAPISCSTTVEPLFGTTLGQAIRPNAMVAQTVNVGNTTHLFRASDSVNIVPASGSTAPLETAVQIQVVNSTQVSAIFQKPHAAGDFMVLSYPCSNIMVQAVNAHPPTSSIWLSCEEDVDASGNGAFHDLLLTLFYSGPAGVLCSDNTANYWILAASGTQYALPSAVSAE